jgi:2,3-bisphosphoglycerate-independent phosphoglycerate mutase
MKRILLVLPDGVGDRTCDELEGRTPLEAAATPFPGRAVLESLGFGVEPPRDAPVAHLGRRHVTPGPEGLAVTDC